ncbi:MAG: hypothetical protein AAFO57_11305, partial [Pseudomonadota bacterium]
VAATIAQVQAAAEAGADTMTKVRDAIEATPVFDRRRQDVREFVESATDGQTVFLDGEALNTLAQADGGAFARIQEDLGLTDEQMTDAMTGQDVEVPAAKLLTVEERSQYEQLLEITRMEPDAVTLAEAREQASRDAMQVDFEEVQRAIELETEALVGFERVQQSVQRQLVDAGRSVEEAEAVGAIWGSVFRVFEEDGIDTEAVFERLGLRIESPNMRPPVEPRMDEPQSLLGFIREQGGVREVFGEGSGAENLNYMEGEMQAAYGVSIPGLVNNQSGVAIDELTRRAQEAGFDLADDQAFLDAVRSEATGDKVYRAEEGRAYAEYLNREQEREAREARRLGNILTQAGEAGYEGSDLGEAAEWLEAVEDGLDMSTEARMARAREMGFDTDTVLYHGTTADFIEFDPEISDSARQTGTPHGAFVFTDDSSNAATYAGRNNRLEFQDVFADGGNIRSVYIRSERDLRVKVQANDDSARTWDWVRTENEYGDVYEGSTNEIARQAMEESFEAVYISGVIDSAAGDFEPGTTVFVFDPSNIRSIHAAFN